MSEQVIPDTTNGQVAMIAAALRLAEKCAATKSKADKNEEYMELLKKFAKAYDLIELVVTKNPSTDEVNGFLERIEKEIRGS